ncbi:hypothetical protein ACJRO7_017182 [Eucalyptus globulus]|uniref:Uncharacterized protein n=1 Tax=Eucalyptus globulus TaxID=34317 RepID=A0ABD3KQ61_EUCGL
MLRCLPNGDRRIRWDPAPRALLGIGPRAGPPRVAVVAGPLSARVWGSFPQVLRTPVTPSWLRAARASPRHLPGGPPPSSRAERRGESGPGSRGPRRT